MSERISSNITPALKKTLRVVEEFGEVDAARVAESTGREYGRESAYLNELTRMGILTKRRAGRVNLFSISAVTVPMEETLSILSSTQPLLEDSMSVTSALVEKEIETILSTDAMSPLYEAVMDLIKRGGKRLRPFLLTESCKAVGGQEEKVVKVAACVELLHTFTLIHNDIISNAFFRRGKPTIHIEWGIPRAILAGDFAYTRAFQTLAEHEREITPSHMLHTIDILAQTMSKIMEGQILDEELLHVNPQGEIPDEQEYLRVAGLMVASFFKACTSIGAIIGGGSTEQVEALSAYGKNLGMALRIFDDCLWLSESHLKEFKAVGGDLTEGRWTMPIIHAVKSTVDPERSTILNVLGNKGAFPHDLRQAILILIKAGSVDYSRKKAAEHAKKAIESLSRLPKTSSRQLLESLALYLTGRLF